MAFGSPFGRWSADATLTANKLVEYPMLVRYGILADLARATLMRFEVLAPYKPLQHVDRHVAHAMVV